MKRGSICLLPKVTSLGGPAAFQKRFSEQAAKLNVSVHFDPNRKDIAAFLVIGAPRRFLPILIMARIHKIPVIQRLNGINWLHRVRNSGLRYFIHSEAANFSIAFVRRFIASGIVYQSTFCEDRWNKVYGKVNKPVQVIYNGINLDDFKPSGNLVNRDSIRIMTVEGNLEHGSEFGLDTALDLIMALAEKYSCPIILRIAGNVDAKVEKQILNEISSAPEHVKVEFLGVVTKQRLAELEAESTFFFSAELQTACPNSVIEALASGLPVIGFDTGALKDVVGNGGIIVPYGTDFIKLEKPVLEPLIEAADAVICHNERFRIEARKRAEKAFPIGKITAAYIDFCFKSHRN
ncbi:MAG: glycosyltransferase family 4 protein [Flexilinea sp.]